MSSLLQRLVNRLTAPVPALPIDIFRILVGLLGFGYFRWLANDAEDYCAPDGIIEHTLTRRIFWYTKFAPFRAQTSLRTFRTLFQVAAGSALLLMVGIKTRLASAVLFFTTAISYRRFFIVMGVEDCIMHLVFFWTMLLPTGRTLSPQNTVSRWREERVSGGTLRLFLGNLAFVYTVAGAWKWTSDLWREGLAVFAVLKTPISRHPHWWQRKHLPLLRIANYFSLIVESLLPFLLFIRTNHPLKWFLAGAATAFHAGIVLTLKIPFANLAMIATLPLFFRKEIAHFLDIDQSDYGLRITIDAPTRIGLTFLSILIPAMLWEARHPEWRKSAFRSEGRLYRFAEWLGLNPEAGHHQNPFYALLWVLGFAQSYRLIDWIDERNHHVVYSAFQHTSNGTIAIDPDTILPTNIRGTMIRTYLGGVPWMKMKPDDLEELRASLFERIAQRFAKGSSDFGRVVVWTEVQRVSAENLDLNQPQRIRLFEFEYNQGQATITYFAPADSASGVASCAES